MIKDEQAEQNGDSTDKDTINKKQPKELVDMSTNGQERRKKKALKKRDESCNQKVISISNQTEDEDKECQKHLAVVVMPTVLLF